MDSLKSRRIQFSAIGLIAILAALAVPVANATPLCPASLALPDAGTVVMGAGTFGDCTGTAPGVLLASLVAPFTASLGTDSGTLISAVYREAGGTLDFYYQVAVNTTSTNCGAAGQPACDSISREADTSFNNGGPWQTWVSTRGDGVGPFVAGTVFPITADRNGTGNVVGFSFSPPDGAKIPPGTTSGILVISTDATSFTAGNSSVIDGGVTTVASFEPAASESRTPEPATFSLLGLGCLLGVGVMRKRMQEGK
jgi:hypothetical protein